MGDWTSDLISKPGVAMIKRSEIESGSEKTQQMTGSTLNKKEAQ
jgi:hypothetical protein